MSFPTLQITLQHRRNRIWPVVAEYSQSPGELSVFREGQLKLDVKAIQTLDCEEYGRMLGSALFAGEIRELLKEEGMRILLVVEDEALRTLHWERLQLPFPSPLWTPLCRSQNYLFSRYLPSLSNKPFQKTKTKDLRALVLVANPYGANRFNGELVAKEIKKALGGIESDLLANLPGALAEPSLKALCRSLADAKYSILHIVAHGDVDPKTKETVLHLTDEDDLAQKVPATKLIKELGTIVPLPPFVFLASCQSAAPQAESGTGLAGLLVRLLGIPAVIAMTESVLVDTAQDLTKKFYSRLRLSGMADLALAEAAIEVAERTDATVPALFTRLRGRPLFFDTAGASLTQAEINYGLDEMEQLFAIRAPVLREAFKRQAERVRQGVWPDAWVEEYCERVLEIDFDSLAREYEFRRSLDRERKLPVSATEMICPFPGLRAFDERETKFFFGRERLVDRLLEKLKGNTFLAVVGSSGTGKSSLVLAGLIPALQRQEPLLRCATMKPGTAPLSTLESLSADFTESTLLVVDQFEEVFTHCQKTEREAFVLLLLELSARYRTVITMRADFHGELAPHEELKEAIRQNEELIPWMTGPELRSAVERQAAAAGLRFEADVARRIMEDLEGEPGAMPLLQHALRELWKRRHGAWLRVEEYELMGGIQQAIMRTADSFYDRQDESGKELVRQVFTRLTRLDLDSAVAEGRRDTRKRINRSDLLPAGEERERMGELIYALSKEGLLVTSERDVEVAHEALIQYWPTLRKWLDEDQEMLRQRERLESDAKLWEENDKDTSYLIHGKRLEAILSASELPRFAMSERAAAYLATCKQGGATENQSLDPQVFSPTEHEVVVELPDYMEIEISLRGRSQLESYEVEVRVSRMDGTESVTRGMARIVPEELSGLEREPVEYGAMLTEQLFGDPRIRESFAMSKAALDILGVMLRLRIFIEPSVPELNAVLWELLQDPETKETLVISDRILFSRYLHSPDWRPLRLKPEAALKALIAVAAPSDAVDFGFTDLRPEVEAAFALDALAGIESTLLGTDQPVTLSGLSEGMRDGVDVVYLFCHGSSLKGEDYVLILQDEEGNASFLRAGALAECIRMLAEPPCLIVLAAPESAAIAPRLVDAGVAAVLAIQSRITMTTEREMLSAFLRELVKDGQIDRAMAVARGAVRDRSDFWMPTLFTRLRGRRIWCQS